MPFAGNSTGSFCVGENYAPVMSLYNGSQSDMRVLGNVLGSASNCLGPGTHEAPKLPC